MCGLFGVVAAHGLSPSVSPRRAAELRDLLTHRGPDDAGLWARDNAVVTHRRLSVIDPGPAGRQPMLAGFGGGHTNEPTNDPTDHSSERRTDTDDDGGGAFLRTWPSGPSTADQALSPRDAEARFVLAYNGELYNDAALRKALVQRGHRFASACDTETVLRALVEWGPRAVGEFRGMFAFAFYDRIAHTLLLARDPLGVKPLYYAADRVELAYASEPGPLLNCPRISAQPNLPMVSAYASTIRTVIGNSTLFDGVHALRPGEVLQASMADGAIQATTGLYWRGPTELTEHVSPDVAAEWTRGAVANSVNAHLRSDVPICCLLSGGLDSSVAARVARDAHPTLRTYCAGARDDDDDPADDDDLAVARETAAVLQTDHAEAVVTRDMFVARWPAMIAALGVPLSTPNEVAIHAVAARLRQDGCVVTLSGEGADELFAGYAGPLSSSHRFLSTPADERAVSPGRFELDECAWIALQHKPAVFKPHVYDAIGQDAALLQAFDSEFAAAAEETGNHGLAAHLRLQRRINLTGLLQRLDTATMLASVEGRTPFADAKVARLAESLPIALKFTPPADDHAQPLTKTVLRDAFRSALPQRVVDRPKASFPLPFQRWMGPLAERVRSSGFARALFTDDAVQLVAAAPERHWNLAWPMINLAIWGDRWWSSAPSASPAAAAPDPSPPRKGPAL